MHDFIAIAAAVTAVAMVVSTREHVQFYSASCGAHNFPMEYRFRFARVQL